MDANADPGVFNRRTISSTLLVSTASYRRCFPRVSTIRRYAVRSSALAGVRSGYIATEVGQICSELVVNGRWKRDTPTRRFPMFPVSSKMSGTRNFVSGSRNWECRQSGWRDFSSFSAFGFRRGKVFPGISALTSSRRPCCRRWTESFFPLDISISEWLMTFAFSVGTQSKAKRRWSC